MKFWAGHKITGKYVNEGLDADCIVYGCIDELERLFYGRLSAFAEDSVKNSLH